VTRRKRGHGGSPLIGGKRLGLDEVATTGRKRVGRQGETKTTPAKKQAEQNKGGFGTGRTMGRPGGGKHVCG